MKKKFNSMVRNQDGISLITAIIFVAIALLITIAFLNMDSVSKGWKSGRTADHFNELQTVGSNIATVKDRSKLLYGGQIVDDNPKFSQTFISPPVSAYVTTGSVVLNGEKGDATNHRTLSINDAGVPSVTEGGAYSSVSGGDAAFTIYDSLNVPIKVTGGATTKKISDAQPNGSPYLSSLTSVDVEEIDRHLFLGLLRGNDTQLGRSLIGEDDTALNATGTMGSDSRGIKPILSLAFGDNTKRYATSSIPDSWFSLTPINISALATTVALDNNRFLDSSKFRLYYVSKVATKENAKTITEAFVTANGVTSSEPGVDVVESLMEVYNVATATVVKDSIIAVPLTEDNIVYSESSDYKYYMFGLYD